MGKVTVELLLSPYLVNSEFVSTAILMSSRLLCNDQFFFLLNLLQEQLLYITFSFGCDSDNVAKFFRLLVPTLNNFINDT